MQIFVRDPAGKTTSYTASSSADLHAQVFSSLSPQDASAARLSYRSRTLYDDLQSIPPYATLDLNFRLPGGGPKKRCAHVYVKPTSGTGSTSSSKAASGSATPASAPVAATSAPGPTAQATDVEMKTTEENKTESHVDAAPAAEAEASTSTAAETAPPTGPEATTSTPSTASHPVSQAHDPILERCGNAALRMVGECAKCSKNFCGQHRLPEDHACPALQTFRKAAFDENMKRLSKEATMTNKISAF